MFYLNLTTMKSLLSEIYAWGQKAFILLFFISVLLLNTNNIFAKDYSDSIFTYVDKTASFKGKPAKIERFVENNLVYPNEAWLNCTEGIVQVSFVITKDGTLMNASVEYGTDPLLDMEALRVVELLKDWKPAIKNGEYVHSRMSVPVMFSLTSQEKEFVQTLRKYGLTDKLPLYVIDNKITNERVYLPDYNLKSLRVMKGEKAIEKYGESAKNGVVIITTKRGTPPVK